MKKYNKRKVDVEGGKRDKGEGKEKKNVLLDHRIFRWQKSFSGKIENL